MTTVDRSYDAAPRSGIGVVGAGRVGAVLGAALRRAGYPVVGVTARSAGSRARAAALLPGVPVLELDGVVAAADIVLLTVPDDALPDVVARLHPRSPGQVLAHTSGRYGLGVLAPAAGAAAEADGGAGTGARALALHPAMTLTGRPDDVARVAGTVFGVTARVAEQPLARTLVRALGGVVEWVAEESRPLYHAALAHAANHLVTLVADSRDALAAAGVSDPARLLGPLVQAALGNALDVGDAALTGPVVRGDVSTVTAHVDALRATLPAVLPAYLAMARRTADRAEAAGLLTAAAADAVRAVLEAVA